ncbi:hypothetical protein BKA70DRAFT_1251684 [Coprinopsis sp. MPI-PUGE-AT-0042]|nr:hypothetical protein BKA70DRAFT_1251684 [Coprinopsis sp. MPI-PUGE-AT-0042]
MFFRFTHGWRAYRLHNFQTRWPIRSLVTATVIPRLPASSASREVPTPLVFVTTSALDAESTKEITTLSAMLAEKGFSCFQIDLTGKPDNDSTPGGLINAYAENLRSMIRLQANPFAPVIVARSASCLVSQQYVSNYPAKAILLISPPKDNGDLEKTRLSEPFDEFTFEPKFPIAVIDTPEKLEVLRKSNRLCKEPNPFVDVISAKKLEGQPLFNAVEFWLDELGI